MDTQPNCEERSESGWKRRADRLRTHRAMRSRRNWPSDLPSPSASVNSIGFESPWASAIHPNLRKKSEPSSQRAGVAGGGRSLKRMGRLSGRPQPHSYRHVERFLRILAIANADEAFTATLARRTSALWQVKARSQEATSPHVYVEGHRKAVYTQTLWIVRRWQQIFWLSSICAQDDLSSIRPSIAGTPPYFWAELYHLSLSKSKCVLIQKAHSLEPRLPDGRLLILHAPSSPFSNCSSGFG